LALGLNDRYLEALAIFDELLSQPELEERIRGRTLNSRAHFCLTLGRLEEALAGHQASLALWRQLGDSLYEGKALVNLGILSYELRRYEEAGRHLAQAALCFQAAEAPDWLPFVYNEQGLVYRDQGRWEEALACFQAAAEGWKHKPADLGLVQNNIGEVYLFQGQVARAITAFQAGLAALRTETYAVDAYLYLGLAYQVSGQMEEAEAAFDKALALALTIGRRDILAELHYRLGELHRRLARPEAALNQFETAVAVIEANREGLRDEGLKISLLGRWQQLYEALILQHLVMGNPAEAFTIAEQARARAFADSLREDSSIFSLEEQAVFSPEERSITAAKVQAALPTGVVLLSYFTTGVLDQDLPLLRQLGPDNPVREHVLTPAQTLLFVISANRLSAHFCPIDPNAFAGGLLRGEDWKRFLGPSVLARLYQLLVAPADNLPAAARHLFIIPHGPLHHVPFGALSDPTNKTSWLQAEALSLAYTPSATILLHPSAPPLPAALPSCLAIGYQGSETGLSLRHTEAEARFIADLTGGAAWVGPDPKGEKLRDLAREQRWLHFACHGRFDYEAPLASYLEIGAGERLTAADILRHWRLQAELVVLSACQSGASQILRGDEPMGLIRAFLQVGAKAVLVSRWPAEDLPTFLLMSHFYRELQRNSETYEPAAALQAAQRHLRELMTSQIQQRLAELPTGSLHPNEQLLLAQQPAQAQPYAHPRYWAGFILVGRVIRDE
jgi:CHAT domain-containing protein/tetratricopeptide (TPR) repeat protein